MRARIVIIVAAVALGVVAAVLAANYLRGARADIASQNQPVEVLVAQKDLPRGLSSEQLVAQGLVKTEKIPGQFVAADAVSSPRVIANQVLATSVGAGEQLTRSRFDYPADAGLSYTVPDGYVAITLAVDDVSGVAGLLKPGDSVIVFSSYEPSGRATGVTQVAIPMARVLAVGEQTSAESAQSGQQKKPTGILGGSSSSQSNQNAYKNVTLALTLAQAQNAAFANQFGDVQLALLPQSSGEPTTTLSPISFKQVAPQAVR